MEILKKNPLGDRWYPLYSHPTQDALYTNPVRFPIIPAGRRSGKSERGKRYITKVALTKKTKFDINRYFCGAPTRAQAKAIFWDDIKLLSKNFWIRDPEETSLTVFTKYGDIQSTIQVLGLDEPARIEGSPWNGGIIDEMRKIKPKAWTQHIVPAMTDRHGWCWRMGVPEGRGSYYEQALEAAGGKIPTTIAGDGVISLNNDGQEGYYSWFSADILDPDEIAYFKSKLDPKLFRQEFEGSFESAEGLVYYGYTPDNYPDGNLDSNISYNVDIPVYLSFDFNVNPMTASLSHRRKVNGVNEIHVFDAYYVPNSNTRSLCDRIFSDYKDTSTFFVTTCHSGHNRQTSAEIGVTDRKIIYNVARKHGCTAIMKNRSKNPAKVDSIAALNSMLYHNKLRLNPKSVGVKEIIKDFEQLCYKENSSEIDKTDKKRGHCSDNLSYLCEYYNQIQAIIDKKEVEHIL